jgi:hypothetical protein
VPDEYRIRLTTSLEHGGTEDRGERAEDRPGERDQAMTTAASIAPYRPTSGDRVKGAQAELVVTVPQEPASTMPSGSFP